MNPKKCVFGVTFGKLLGHIVSQKGIEVDPDKVKAIRKMPAPETKREVRGFIGQLQYISKFIAKLTTICDLIFKLLKKNQPVIWDEKCQQGFETIKNYLMNPPVLQAPRPGKMLILYLAIEKGAIGAMLAQEGSGKVEHVVYYLSKKLLPYESNYSLVEKTCLTVIWATKKLRHYFQSYRIQTVSKHDPLRYLQQTPSLTGKLARWLLLVTEFDIDYVAKKVIKGRVVVDFLAQNPVNDEQKWELEFPDEHLGAIEIQTWTMYFDGAVNSKGASVGVILISPEGEMIPMAKRLEFEATNNQAEYEACIYGLEALRSMGAEEITVYGDSMLVVKQISDQ